MSSEQTNLLKKLSAIHRLGVAFILLMSLSFGCNKSDRPELAQLEGTVTFQGEPLKTGAIVFESKGHRPANARIENGNIVGVTTYVENDGVPVGSHRVAVFATSAASGVVASDPSQDTAVDTNYMGAAPSLLPDKYGDPTLSGLTAEIQPGTNTINFELE